MPGPRVQTQQQQWELDSALARLNAPWLAFNSVSSPTTSISHPPINSLPVFLCIHTTNYNVFLRCCYSSPCYHSRAFRSPNTEQDTEQKGRALLPLSFIDRRVLTRFIRLLPLWKEWPSRHRQNAPRLSPSSSLMTGSRPFRPPP